MSTSSLSEILTNALTLVNQKLSAFTLDSDFNQKLTLAFGDSINSATYQSLWNTNDFNIQSVVDIEIRNKNELNGAKGAFSRDTDKIYLSKQYLQQNRHNLSAIAEVIL